MKKTIINSIIGGSILLAAASSASAGYLQPGETMGVSLCSPLPEGIFVADLESYGRGNSSSPNIGVNQPVMLWSTPYSAYNTRLEIFVGQPFVHIDHGLTITAPVGLGFGPILAHDFGNGLTGGFGAFIKTPDASSYLQTFVTGRNVSEGDFRQSFQYIFAKDVTIIENFGVTSALGQNYYGPLKQNDLLAGDFTIEKTFGGKLTVGITGFGNTDIDDRNKNRTSSIELGGLVAYDFGRFNVTAIVTRSVYVQNGNLGVSDTLAGGYETRGWLRVVVPVYLAPPPLAPVVARY